MPTFRKFQKLQDILNLIDLETIVPSTKVRRSVFFKSTKYKSVSIKIVLNEFIQIKIKYKTRTDIIIFNLESEFIFRYNDSIYVNKNKVFIIESEEDFFQLSLVNDDLLSIFDSYNQVEKIHDIYNYIITKYKGKFNDR